MSFWVGACLAMVLAALAAVAPAADLRGRVESQNNLSAPPIPQSGSRVDLMDSTGQRAIASTYTGPDGLYYFRKIEPGNYRIRVNDGTYPLAVESRDYQDISPIRAVLVEKGIELTGGRRIALKGELEGKVWVYVSPRCGNPCMPQLLVYKADPEIANFGESTTLDLIRPVLRRRGKLLFDNPVGPDTVKANFSFEGRQYHLTGRTKGRIDRIDKTIEFDVYRQ